MKSSIHSGGRMSELMYVCDGRYSDDVPYCVIFIISVLILFPRMSPTFIYPTQSI